MKKKLIMIMMALAVLALVGICLAAEKSEADLAIEKLMKEMQEEKGSAGASEPIVRPADSEPAGAKVPAAEAKPAEPAAPVSAVVPAPEARPKKPEKLEAGATETYASLFVDVEWLKKNINGVILIDTRTESVYAGQSGHLPGAVNSTWTYYANVNVPTGTMKYGTLWQEVTMAKRIGALGINGGKPVVVYDDGAGWGQAGYVTVILRMCGIKNAKILDGGFLAWKKADGKISNAKHSNKAVAFSVKAYNPTYVVNTKWVDDNIGKPNFALIDVRTPQEYLGKIRPFGEKRAGHLPTAINIPMGDFSTSEFKWKSVEEIKAIMTKAGIKADDEIVVYDTAGVRAANVLMMLRYAGYANSRFYDESYQAWAGDAKLDIEQ